VLKISEALSASKGGEIKESTKESLVKLWDSYQESLLNSLEKRTEERTQALEKSLQRRCDKEVADFTAILTELQRSIEQELTEFAKPLQLKLDLFNDAEQQQLESNRNSLKARLEDIPQEIEQETKLIKDRFANLSSRLFPLAIAFLIPQKYA
jgi:exonuclease VII large subunit